MEVLDHLVFGLEAEIQNAILGINTPAELVLARQFGYNDSTKRVNIFDGTGVNYLLQDNDISIDADFTVDSDKLTTRAAIKIYVDSIVGGVGAFRGDHDASGGAVPTATEIKAGDYWRITGAGTITGVTPDGVLQAGDLIFARIDNATNGADFFSVQANFSTAADVPLLTTGTYEGTATNVQDALVELWDHVPFDLGNGLAYQTGTGAGTGTTLHVLFGTGLQIGAANELEVHLTDFVTGATATGTEILASIGTGANLGKIVLDSADITAAIGDFLPLAGNTALTAFTGDIFVDTTQTGGFKIVDKDNAGSSITFGDTAPISISQNGSAWGLGNITNQIQVSFGAVRQRSTDNDTSRWTQTEISPQDFLLSSSTGKGVVFISDDGLIAGQASGLRYLTDLTAGWDALSEADRARQVPDIGYVTEMIAGGVDFASLAGQGINFTGDIYNIDLDANSGLELNGTLPDGKLRLKGLADYTAIIPQSQLGLGYNTDGNLVINTEQLTGLYLPLSGTVGTDHLGGLVEVEDSLEFRYTGTSTISKYYFRNSDGFSISSQSADMLKNAWITVDGATGSASLFTTNSVPHDNGSIGVNTIGAYMSAGLGVDAISVSVNNTRKAMSYTNHDYAVWNALSEAERDRIIPTIGYVKDMVTTGGRESYDITGTGAIRIFDVTHTKGTFPIVQVYRVDTNALVTATITNVSATQVRVTFAANVPLGRVHKVVIV